MASEAQVDLLISTAGALPALERDLSRIINQAENNASPVNVSATLDSSASLGSVSGELNRLVAEATATAPEIEIAVDIDEDSLRRFDDSARNVQNRLTGLVGPASRVAGIVGGIGLAAGGAVPAVAGLAAALGEIAPAAALAVSAQLTFQLATNTLKLAMVGVSDAIETAFDPEARPEDLAKAVEQLAPNARAFVTELSGMRGALSQLQSSVQNDFFQGLAGDLETLSRNVLPDVAAALRRTSSTLNEMARGAIAGANALGTSGVLGQALTSSTTALANLTTLPGNLVAGLGLIATAAGPAFERITAAAGEAGDSITGKLIKAFESGALEESINNAVSAIGQLGRSVGNIFSGLNNIMRTFAGTGDGLFGTLEKVTQAFEDLTAAKGFQDAITALSGVLSTVASTVLPLISQALQALGPVFTTLAPPIQSVVRLIGETLGKVLTALGPVLVSVSAAFGNLLTALAPFVALAGDLIAALLPVLVPLFNAFAQVLAVVTPFATALADTLSGLLVPILQGIAPIVEALLIPFVSLYQTVMPEVTRVLEELQPVFIEIGSALGQVLAAAGPVIAAVIRMSIVILKDLMPAVRPAIDLLIEFVTAGLSLVSGFLTNVVVPALQIVSQFLEGDFQGALETSRDAVFNFKEKGLQLFVEFQNGVKSVMHQFATETVQAVQGLADDFNKWISDLVQDAADSISDLPSEFRNSIGDTGRVLFDAGVNIVQGLISGIQSKVGSLVAVARSIADTVTSTISSALDIRSPSRKTRKQGEETVQGYVNGVKALTPLVKDAFDVLAQIPVAAFGRLSEPASEAFKRLEDAAKKGQEEFRKGSQAPTPIPQGAFKTLAAPFSKQAALLATEGQTTPVVNVYLGNQLVNQFINDRLRTVLNSQSRIVSQGIRI